MKYLKRLGIDIDGEASIDGVNNEVLSRHRFTNAYRASDRVSQFLLTEVMYDRERPWTDVFARTMLFKLFNRVDTWTWVRSQVHDINAGTILGEGLEDALRDLAARRPIYSAAYIMPPPINRLGPKYLRHLEMLRDMIKSDLPQRIRDASSLRGVYDLLVAWDGIGPFLGYQYATDLNYADQLGHDENSFVVAGPGAIRGLRKCFDTPGSLTPSDLIRWVVERQNEEFSARSLPWCNLWGRPLQLIDAQNLFCEVDKYARAAHPELSKFARGTRIKQTYRPLDQPMTAWFPPRWGINDRANVAVLQAQSAGSRASRPLTLF